MSPLNLASPPPPRRLKRLPLALLLAGSASWTQGYAAETETPVAAAAGKTATATSQLETVTVTTRRREESSQDVPTPMSVVKSSKLNRFPAPTIEGTFGLPARSGPWQPTHNSS